MNVNNLSVFNIYFEFSEICWNIKLKPTNFLLYIDYHHLIVSKYFTEDKLQFVNAIAKPMASRKLTKKIYKLIKKASKERTKNVINGLKDVQTRIRKGEKGLVIFAGTRTETWMRSITI